MQGKSKLNKTLYYQDISEEERQELRKEIIYTNSLELTDFVDGYSRNEYFINKTICGDSFAFFDRNIQSGSIPLIIIDPPYNIDKKFSNDSSFKKSSYEEYENYIESILIICKRLISPNGTIYLCNDYKGSFIQKILSKYFYVRNRISWKREKGRSAAKNFKNNSEDIWFLTNSNDYVFNADSIKIKKKVIAPYKKDGKPKDWVATDEGNIRYTGISNIWDDIVVPFWSMPENSEHVTQKPEQVIERLILASSNPGDMVLDFFLGSGTTSVVAKKNNRNYIGLELDEKFCIIAQKRINRLNSGN
jgi:site-specific DNA-methyltransferase (adenine-specific)